jgi:hypothetical protein
MKWINTYPEWQLVTEQQGFKIYRLANKPDWVYRRAGTDSVGNTRWQYQAKAGEKYWHDVENKKSLDALNAQYQKNMAAQGDTVNRDNPDYWTLIAIIACETFETKDHTGAKQAMADVAQAIYNRYNTPSQPYGKTIREIILAPGQFQPVKNGLATGANWRNIKNKEDAIQVYIKTRGRKPVEAKTQIQDAVKAQGSALLRSNASQHVGSRTEFLAAPPKSTSAVGMVERDPVGFNNCFYWRYAGKTQFHDKGVTSATSMPASVKTA